MDVLKLPAQDKRVETGPVQFGDDWPGVFIRGDSALFAAITVAQAAGAVDDKYWLLKSQLKGLADTLRSCSVGDTGWPPR